MESLFQIDDLLKVWAQAHPYLIYVVLFAIIFLETGLIFAAFLPGDTLLFMAGMLAAQTDMTLHIGVLAVTLTVAAILGPVFNYWSGYWFGKEMLKLKRFHPLDEHHMERIHRFYERFGAVTNIVGRFVAFVRTFAPFVAGVGRMDYTSFMIQNVIGGFLWINFLLWGGYFLGQTAFMQTHADKVGWLTLIMLPMAFLLPLVKMFFRKRKASV